AKKRLGHIRAGHRAESIRCAGRSGMRGIILAAARRVNGNGCARGGFLRMPRPATLDVAPGPRRHPPTMAVAMTSVVCGAVRHRPSGPMPDDELVTGFSAE